MTFGSYARYYDLLYADKDYAGEVAYLRSLLEPHPRGAVRSLLELGCGTGLHAGLLAAQGLSVLGVDASAGMIARARERARVSGLPADRLAFDQGDARSFGVARRFDVVASLFHVLSYQVAEADLQALIRTAASHLEPGGLFVFDFWYGPAVLWQRPAVRVKRWADDQVAITRLAEPVLHDAEGVVDVNYTLFVQPRAGGPAEEIREQHRMRYLFLPELDRLLAGQGLERVRTEEWMTGRPPSVETWGLCVVARKA